MPLELYNAPVIDIAEKALFEYLDRNRIKIDSYFRPDRPDGVKNLNISIPSNLNDHEHAKELYVESSILQRLNKCDGFVFINSYTKRNNNPKFGPGLLIELEDSLRKDRKIFKIFTKLDLSKSEKLIECIGIKEIMEMNIDTIKQEVDKLYMIHSPEEQGWTLKRVEDYRKFYENQPAIKELMKKLCYNKDIEKIGVSGILPYISNAYMRNSELLDCHKHYGYKHGYIDPTKQNYWTICPFLENKDEYHMVTFTGIPRFPDNELEIMQLLTKNRVIHKFTYIFDPIVYEKGPCLRNETGKPILNKDNKLILDEKLVKGAEFLIDIDIRDTVKDTGKNFFNIEIYDEYVKVVRFLIGDNIKDYKLMFSGNGIYIIKKRYYEFEKLNTTFNDYRLKYKSLMENKNIEIQKVGIKYLMLDHNHGWNKYFKMAFTLHASKERVSIPLNVEEFLDNQKYIKYIDENSSIKNLLENKVSAKDILTDSKW